MPPKPTGIHPVIGCEVYVSQQGHKTRSDTDRYNHLVLLCETQDGYRNRYRPRLHLPTSEGFYYLSRASIKTCSRSTIPKGFICLSACLRGDINETILADKYDDARRLAYTYQDIFGKNNFFLEIQDHGLEQDRRLTPQVNRLSHETGIPLVATNDSHYLRREDARAHEILMCIQTGKTMTDPNRMHWDHPDFYLKTRDEMMKLFGELEESLDRTWEIAQRCHVSLDKVKEPFPAFADVSPKLHADVHTYFEYVARQGIWRKAAPAPRSPARIRNAELKHDLAGIQSSVLEREIAMIQQMKFSGYFLIVWDFIRYAKSDQHSRGPGARIGGRQSGQLRHADHRHRPAAVRSAVRTLSQSRTRQHARYRHRLLHEPPG